MKSTFVAAACVFIGLAACGQGPESVHAEADELTLSSVQMRDAERDANAALARGDTRLVGVVDYAREVPGAPSVSAYENEHCVRMIEGTNDFENTAANKRALDYAERYNARVLSAASRLRASAKSAPC